jgi:hypothetical protein
VFLVLVLAVLLYWQRDRLHAVLVRGPGEGTPTLSDHAGEVPATGQIDTGHGTARATLYEEDSTDAQGKPQVGSVVWRTETASPEPGQPLELAIRAELEVPERHIKMTMTIRRNTDKALPATHTVEIMFNLPADFRFGGARNRPITCCDDDQAQPGPKRILPDVLCALEGTLCHARSAHARSMGAGTA